MAGWLTAGVPQVMPTTTNTTLNTPANGLVTNVSSAMLLPVDTQLPSGENNQTVAATAFQVAAMCAGMLLNTATSTVHAATLNTASGFITTEALTTAAGAAYTFTLTNSLLTAAVAAPQVQVHFGTCTAGVAEVTSVVNGSGNTVIAVTNRGTAAFNGTIGIAFHV